MDKLLNALELFSLLIRTEPVLKLPRCDSPRFSLEQSSVSLPVCREGVIWRGQWTRNSSFPLPRASPSHLGVILLSLATHSHRPITSFPTQAFSSSGHFLITLMNVVLWSLLRKIRKSTLKVTTTYSWAWKKCVLIRFSHSSGPLSSVIAGVFLTIVQFCVLLMFIWPLS